MYFNYSANWPSTWWERRSFLHAWWRIYAGDRQWAPPAYTALARIIQAVADPHYARLSSQPLYMEALPQRSTANGHTPHAPMTVTPLTAAMAFEEPVAATLLQIDRRRNDDGAYLGLLRCANDEETLERLLAKAFEHVAEQGCRMLLGPTSGFGPWQPGALVSHFSRTPPWHTPYNPPYAGDLFGARMEPWLETALYEVAVPAGLPPAPEPALIAPLAPARLAGDLLQLLVESLRLDDAFPAADAVDAQALLAWLQTTVAPQAWLATVGGERSSAWAGDGANAGEAVGFVMLQPDLAPLLQRTGGGRRWLGRSYLALRRRAPVRAGRLLLGAVTPAWRGQGIGLQLWRNALAEAQRAGWQTLTCGPVPVDSEAAAFLARQGARPQQRYVTYRWSPW